MNDQVTLWHGDCLELMGQVEDQSIDMILCDLPYGTTACKWDSVIPFEPLWAHYRRIINPRGAIVLTGSQPFTTDIVNTARDLFKYCWVWEKTRPTDFVNAKNKPMKIHEDVCVFSLGTTANCSPRRMTYNPQGTVPVNGMRKASVSQFGTITGKRPSHKANYFVAASGYPVSVLRFASEGSTVHPTQKPVDLFAYLIRTYTNEGEVVLDNCLGSGTTAVAAIRTGRRCIGIEKEREYFDIAQKRVAEEYAKTALFDSIK